jgi:hypothetical protein
VRTLLALGLAALPALSQPQELPRRLEIRGVANFAQVSPVLYRGAQPTQEGFRELKRLGVKTVLSMRAGDDDAKLIAGQGLRLVRISSRAWLPRTRNVVAALKVILEPRYQPFVHCQAGKDRTGLVVAAYEILFLGKSVDEAVSERRSYGAAAIWSANETFLDRLRDAAVREGLLKQIANAPVPSVELVE